MAKLFRISNSRDFRIFYCTCRSTASESVSRDGYFFEGLNILVSTFFVCVDCFQGFICFFEITYKFWKCLLKPSSWEFPSLWLVDVLECWPLIGRINLLPAVSGVIFQNHRRLPVISFSVKIAALGSLKRITGRIFKISKLFRRSKPKLWVWFFLSTKKQKIEKLIAHFIIISLNTNIHLVSRDTIPLNHIVLIIYFAANNRLRQQPGKSRAFR